MAQYASGIDKYATEISPLRERMISKQLLDDRPHRAISFLTA
jgi:hypothetical protein